MNARIIDLPKFPDKRGNLSVMEQMREIPFEIKRAYWIYDVPGGEERDGHAYRNGMEFIIALSGSFDIKVEHNGMASLFSLNRSYSGLLIPPGHWRTLTNFSTNSVALILSSTFYDPSDYISDHTEFLSI